MEKEVAFLALTIAIELPVAMIVFQGRDWRRIVITVVSVNMITHPIAWHFAAMGTSILFLEIIITAFESIILALLFSRDRFRAVIAGIAMNSVSAAIGIIFF